MGPRFGTMLLGLGQLLVGVALAVLWRAGHPPVIEQLGDDAALAQLMVHGVAHYLYFLFATPWGWLALWLYIEGFLRIVAGVAGQPFAGTAPLALARLVRGWLHRPPPPPPDLVRAEGDAIVIDSGHDYDWHALTTVDVDGRLYSVTRQAGQGARPHRYRLQPIAHDRVIRAVVRYRSRSSSASKP